MICPKCGNDAGNSPFCTKCGNHMNAAPQAPAAPVNGYAQQPRQQAPYGYAQQPRQQAPYGYAQQPQQQAPYGYAPRNPQAPQSHAQGAQAFASNAAAQAGATMNNVQSALEHKTGKKLPRWAVPAIAAGAVVIIVLLICIIAGSGNNYKKPVKEYQQFLNTIRKNDGDITNSDLFDYEAKSLNGFCSGDFKKIVKIMGKIDDEDYDPDEEIETDYEFEGNVKVKIDDKEEADEDELDDYHDSIKSYGKEILEYVKEIEDAAEDDDDFYADAADELGISESEVKSLVKYMKSIGEDLKDNKVKAGYELDLEIEGVEDHDEGNVVVLKVNGKWVSLGSIAAVANICYSVADTVLYAA